MAHIGQEFALGDVGGLGGIARGDHVLKRAFAFGNVGAFGEDTGHRTVSGENRLIQQVDIAPFHGAARLALQIDGQGVGAERLARPVNFIEKIEIALARRLGHRIAHGAADDVAVADQLLIGRVGIVEDMFGTARHRHEGRRFLEQLHEAFTLVLQFAFGQDLLRGFDDDGDDAGGPAAFVGHRRIVEVHPHLFGFAGAVECQFLVGVCQGLARQPDLHDIVVEVGDLGPALANLRSQKLRVAAAGEHRIGVVIDHVAVFAPQHDDRHGRAQQDAGGSAQAFRPRRDRTQRRVAPVEIGDQTAGFAAGLLQAVDEGRGRRLARVRLGIG